MRGVVTVLVIAVAAVLGVGVVLTAVVRFREAAARVACQNHLRQVGWFALWDVVDPGTLPKPKRGEPRPTELPPGWLPDAATFPPATVVLEGVAPEDRLSLYATLLPGLGRQKAWEAIDLARGWDADANQRAARMLVPELVCPSAFAGSDGAVPTNYVANAGIGPGAASLSATDPRAGLFGYDRKTPAAAVADGLSHTLCLVETTREVGPWLRGGPSTARSLLPDQRPLGPGGQFGGAHPGGANVNFADGSVRFLADAVSPDVLRAMLAIADPPEPE